MAGYQLCLQNCWPESGRTGRHMRAGFQILDPHRCLLCLHSASKHQFQRLFPVASGVYFLKRCWMKTNSVTAVSNCTAMLLSKRRWVSHHKAWTYALVFLQNYSFRLCLPKSSIKQRTRNQLGGNQWRQRKSAEQCHILKIKCVKNALFL